MDLAAHLGMTVGRLQAEMSLRELLMWRIKWAADPWGEVRADLRAALISSVLVNINRDPKKEAVTLDKFVLFPRLEPEPDQRYQRGPKVDPKLRGWLDAMATVSKSKSRAKGKKPNGD